MTPAMRSGGNDIRMTTLPSTSARVRARTTLMRARTPLTGAAPALAWLTAAMALIVAAPAALAAPAPVTPSNEAECPGCILPTDEIQVYDASITEVGHWNLVWHNNFSPKAQTVPDFAGGVVPDHTLNGVPEWAYGLRPWLELGAYVPIYSYSARGGLQFDGVKLRTLFVVPHADERKFFYGVNFEYSYNEAQWDPSRFTGEIRPIIGTHLGRWDLIVNPALDTDLTALENFNFAPEARVAYNVRPKLALAAEWYASFGPVSGFLPGSLQGQNLFAVVDLGSGAHGIEFGVGHGYTRGSTPLIFKLMFMQDL